MILLSGAEKRLVDKIEKYTSQWKQKDDTKIVDGKLYITSTVDDDASVRTLTLAEAGTRDNYHGAEMVDGGGGVSRKLDIIARMIENTFGIKICSPLNSYNLTSDDHKQQQY